MNGRKTTVYKQSGRGKLREFCPDLLTHGYKASPAPSLMSVPLLLFNSPQTHTHTSSLLAKQQTTIQFGHSPSPHHRICSTQCSSEPLHHKASSHAIRLSTNSIKREMKHAESVLLEYISFLFPFHCSKHSIHRVMGMRLGVSVHDTDIKQCLSLAAIHCHFEN